MKAEKSHHIGDIVCSTQTYPPGKSLKGTRFSNGPLLSQPQSTPPFISAYAKDYEWVSNLNTHHQLEHYYSSRLVFLTSFDPCTFLSLRQKLFVWPSLAGTDLNTWYFLTSLYCSPLSSSTICPPQSSLCWMTLLWDLWNWALEFTHSSTHHLLPHST